MIHATVRALSGGKTALIYLGAFMFFILGASRSRPRAFPAWWSTLLASGFALITFVVVWNVLALIG